MTDLTSNRTQLILEIEAGLREAIAHRRGELALETRRIDVAPAARGSDRGLLTVIAADPEAGKRALAEVAKGK